MYIFKKEKIKKSFFSIFLLIIIIMFFFIIYNIYSKIEIYNKPETIDIDKTISSIKEEKLSSENISSMLSKVTSSVVGVSKIKNIGDSVFLNNSASQLGLGSGVIISENGYIVSNAHVCGNKYSQCYITLDSGEICNGTVVWADDQIDLAIIKISKYGLNYINLGDSNNTKVGETVYAIGNPLGFEFQRTVTSGIVSALDRVIKFEENDEVVYLSNLIQTDATINPGNSGGPLINIDGKVVGINSVKVTSAEGIGFAIPINVLKPIIKSFLETGNFEEAKLGIFAYDKNVIPYIHGSKKFDTGIYVEKVEKSSLAEKAGLKKGDIILSIDDNNLSKMCQLREYIYSKKPGDSVVLQVLNKNVIRKLKIFLIKF